MISFKLHNVAARVSKRFSNVSMNDFLKDSDLRLLGMNWILEFIHQSIIFKHSFSRLEVHLNLKSDSQILNVSHTLALCSSFEIMSSAFWIRSRATSKFPADSIRLFKTGITYLITLSCSSFYFALAAAIFLLYKAQMLSIPLICCSFKPCMHTLESST